MKHCCDCKYWDGEPIGFWHVTTSLKHFAAGAKIRCTHPKHFKQPKYNSRKACKYFEQKEIKAVIISGTV